MPAAYSMICVNGLWIRSKRGHPAAGPRMFSGSASARPSVGRNGWRKPAPARHAASGGDHKSKAIEVHAEWLLKLIADRPDATLEDIQTALNDAHGLKKSLSCLWRFYARWDRIGEILKRFSVQQRRNYFAHQGYVST